MNLATRCLQCGTVFRVAEDQLLSSEGWVRCGRCHGVFNATEVLFDIDTNAPMRLAPTDDGWAAANAPGPVPAQAQTQAVHPQAPTASPGAPAIGATAMATFPDLVPHQPPPLPEDAPFEALLRAPSRLDDDAAGEPIIITDHVPPVAPVPVMPSPARDDAPRRPADVATADPAVAAPAAARPDAPRDAPAEMPAAVTRPAPQPAPARRGEPALADAPPQVADAAAAADAAVPPTPTPSFLRQAERRRLARHPAVRAAAVAAAVLLALAVPLQMALLWRDALATHLPASQPALQALCRLVGCSVQPLRRIQQLAVGSSALSRVDGAPLYRLQLVLHNRADTAVLAPAVDLTLTDPQGQLLARRVLPAAELGLAQTALQPGQELPIQLLLSTGERRVAGYTLELFYP